MNELGRMAQLELFGRMAQRRPPMGDHLYRCSAGYPSAPLRFEYKMHVTSDVVAQMPDAPPASEEEAPATLPGAAASDVATPVTEGERKSVDDEDGCPLTSDESGDPFYQYTARGELFNIPCRYYPNCWFNDKCKYLHGEKRVRSSGSTSETSKPKALCEKTSMAQASGPSMPKPRVATAIVSEGGPSFACVVGDTTPTPILPAALREVLSQSTTLSTQTSAHEMFKSALKPADAVGKAVTPPATPAAPAAALSATTDATFSATDDAPLASPPALSSSLEQAATLASDAVKDSSFASKKQSEEVERTTPAQTADGAGEKTYLMCGSFYSRKCRDGAACQSTGCRFAHPLTWTCFPTAIQTGSVGAFVVVFKGLPMDVVDGDIVDFCAPIKIPEGGLRLIKDHFFHPVAYVAFSTEEDKKFVLDKNRQMSSSDTAASELCQRGSISVFSCRPVSRAAAPSVTQDAPEDKSEHETVEQMVVYFKNVSPEISHTRLKEIAQEICPIDQIDALRSKLPNGHYSGFFKMKGQSNALQLVEHLNQYQYGRKGDFIHAKVEWGRTQKISYDNWTTVKGKNQKPSTKIRAGAKPRPV